LIPVVSSSSSFIGPLIGGVVAQADENKPLNPAYVGLALNTMALLLVILFMRKSPLDKDKGPRRFFQPRSSSVGSKASAKRLTNSSGSLVEWYALSLLIICTAASSAGTQGWSVLLITVQKELDLSSMVIGLISGWCGLAVIIGQLLLLPFMLRKLKWSEVQVMLFGFAISSCILALGFISNLWAVLILGWVFSLGLPLVMTVVFAMFSRLCDPSVKGRVVGLVAFVSNMTKVFSVLLCGVLYDIAKWIPYTMLFAVVVCGILASIALMGELPRALSRRRSKRLLIAATTSKTTPAEGEEQPVLVEKHRGLPHRFGFDYEDERQSTLGMPYGRATADEIEEIIAWAKLGFERRPRLPLESKSVLIPDLVKSLLG
ncbi:hypothetical protein FOZ62_002223, partial [Perkinsus olseni]